MQHTLALDPGATTGWVLYPRYKALPDHGQLPYELVWKLLNELWPEMIVCESFIYRPMKGNIDLSPVEVIGIVKEWARQNMRPVEMQSPSDVMSQNRRLRP